MTRRKQAWNWPIFATQRGASLKQQLAVEPEPENPTLLVGLRYVDPSAGEHDGCDWQTRSHRACGGSLHDLEIATGERSRVTIRLCRDHLLVFTQHMAALPLLSH